MSQRADSLIGGNPHRPLANRYRIGQWGHLTLMSRPLIAAAWNRLLQPEQRSVSTRIWYPLSLI